MEFSLNTRMIKALKKLRDECDYLEMHSGGNTEFVHRGQLGTGVGAKTLSELLKLGLIEEGPCGWRETTGYRITDRGREALNNPNSQAKAPRRRKLRTIQPRLNEIKSKLGKS
ncbi:MAG: hypothetical protein AAF666_17670 [Pseudomonadota bacterium]